MFKYKNFGNNNYAYQKKGSFYMLKILIAAMVTLSIITACGRDDNKAPDPTPAPSATNKPITDDMNDMADDLENGAGDAMKGAGDAVNGVGDAMNDAGNSMKNMR